MLVAARRPGLGQVRAYLAADLLRRLSERGGLAPTVIDLLPDREAELRALCDQLNIHPPRHTLTEPFDAGQLAGQFSDGMREPAFDVGVRAAGKPPGPVVVRLAGHWLEVPGERAPDESAALAGERLELGEEPLAVRLNLLRQGYGAVAGDGPEPRAGQAGSDAAELARWRELVARWARSPSGAMSRTHAEAITAAFADDLDTAAALRELAGLAGDASVPDGVKFETFAAADRLLGLDLARDIGKF